jgi:Asp-tRNA(Asn)/Glu-tRNA(Gln) amidotransferase A subunit family amidase
MSGVVTLKPTENRFTLRHCIGGVPGRGRMALGKPNNWIYMHILFLGTGLYTHTVDEQIFMLEQTLGSLYLHETSPKHVPLPLNLETIKKTTQRKLKIGYFLDDGFLKPTPGCARVVSETVEKLRNDGHEMIHFKVPRPYEAASLTYKSIMTDGGTYLCKLYEHDLVDPYLSNFVTLINVSVLQLSFLTFSDAVVPSLPQFICNQAFLASRWSSGSCVCGKY